MRRDSQNRVKPVLSLGQWERLLRAEELPVLEPDEAAALILWQQGWFAWHDADEHARIAGMMHENVEILAQRLSQQSDIKTDPNAYFQTMRQYQNVCAHRDWHADMAHRIAALLPPKQLIQRLAKEKKRESEGMEVEDRGEAGLVSPAGEGDQGDGNGSGRVIGRIGRSPPGDPGRGGGGGGAA